MPGRALIIVDFQNDFTPGGALAVPHGDEISQRVNELAAGSFDLVIATRDWHPPDHGSFETQGGPWPVHCVAGTPGAELDPALERGLVDIVLDKGQDRDTEGYSGFEGTDLEQILRDRDIDEVVVCGLATDYCVKNTALDALRAGFRVLVDERAVRGVDAEPGDSRRALGELRGCGAQMISFASGWRGGPRTSRAPAR
ncbi:MAG TPA: nicotinamidase [Solirubrobacteraceae bacterium]|nr:nicotinamidase [Solirubrobacteraceae bacterium]